MNSFRYGNRNWSRTKVSKTTVAMMRWRIEGSEGGDGSAGERERPWVHGAVTMRSGGRAACSDNVSSGERVDGRPRRR